VLKLNKLYIDIIVKIEAFYDKFFKKTTTCKAYSVWFFVCNIFRLVFANAADKLK
jgi:hypothetical protein